MKIREKIKVAIVKQDYEQLRLITYTYVVICLFYARHLHINFLGADIVDRFSYFFIRSSLKPYSLWCNRLDKCKHVITHTRRHGKSRSG